MGTKHNISYAEELFAGKARYSPYNTSGRSQRGLAVNLPVLVSFGAIAADDRDGLVESVNPADNATLTLRATVTGMVNAGGVVTLDTPRCLSIYSAATDETAKSITFTGTDEYGAALVETLAGPAADTAVKIVYTKKAFKTVSSAVATGNFGTIEVGFGPKIGLPFRVSAKNRIVPLINGLPAAPVALNTLLAAVGTAQDAAIISPVGGVITKALGVSAAANGTGISTVTITRATLEVAVLAFAADYAALAAVEDTSIKNQRLAANDVLKVATDGTGDGGGQANIVVEVDPAFVTLADDTTATASTGDVRGTVDFGFTPNGTHTFGALIYPDRTTKELAFGIAQYGG